MCRVTFHINTYKIAIIRKKIYKIIFYAKIKWLILKINYMGYSKLCYALLDLTKVMILAFFYVIICIEFELFNY
jgi:hypothetical protein